MTAAQILRNLNPERMALLDLAMWKAYYQHRWLRLAGLLLRVLREGFGLSLPAALQCSFYFGRAAMRFRHALRGPAVDVRPDLTRGYAVIRRDCGAAFDPRAAAEAELAWWQARRDPQRSDPATVGALMASLYAILYDKPPQVFARAAFLRAEAAWMRDRQEENPDWTGIGARLLESYRALAKAVP